MRNILAHVPRGDQAMVAAGEGDLPAGVHRATVGLHANGWREGGGRSKLYNAIHSDKVN
jgi:hypothetical protein